MCNSIASKRFWKRLFFVSVLHFFRPNGISAKTSCGFLCPNEISSKTSCGFLCPNEISSKTARGFARPNEISSKTARGFHRPRGISSKTQKVGMCPSEKSEKLHGRERFLLGAAFCLDLHIFLRVVKYMYDRYRAV